MGDVEVEASEVVVVEVGDLRVLGEEGEVVGVEERVGEVACEEEDKCLLNLTGMEVVTMAT